MAFGHIGRTLPTRALFAATFLLLFVGPLMGGPAPVVERRQSITDDRPWSFRLSIYGWLESLDGTTGVLGVESDISVDFKDVLKHLNLGIMGALEVRYRRWGFTADMIYADVAGSAATPFGIFFDEIDFEEKMFLGTFHISYRLLDQADFKFDLFAGARVNWQELSLTFKGGALNLPLAVPPIVVADRSISADQTWVDPIIGARLQRRIFGPCFARLNGDVGGFGVASDLTWQVTAVLGIEVSRSFSTGLGYRALGTDYTNDGFKYDVVGHGPVLGAEFRF